MLIVLKCANTNIFAKGESEIDQINLLININVVLQT